MYQNKLVVAVKSNNKTLREFGESVYLPFGSEYSLLVKNKNSVRVSVKIEIDGIDVTEGVSLIVDPNDEIELERFIKNGNLSRGNRFKFIERTQAVMNHRGAKAEDGIVRVEYQFEKPAYVRPQPICPDPWYPKGPSWPSNPMTPSDPWCTGPMYLNNVVGTAGLPQNSAQTLRSKQLGTCDSAYASCSNDVGITAPGSVSSQEFYTVSNFALDPQKHVIVMRLLGEVEGKTVSTSVTTRTRTTCVTCGHRSRTTAKFCSQCGTSLQIV